MAKTIIPTKFVSPEFQGKRGALKTEAGLIVNFTAKAIFDTAGTDSSGASNKTVASHGLGVWLPIGAIIQRMYWQVKTAFTSTNSTSTIAFQAESAGDLYAATAVSGAPGSTGFKAGIPDNTVTHMLSTTAEREIKAVVAVEALLAGKGIAIVEYTMGL